MSNLFTERVLNMAAVTPRPEDYTGEDGLLYCGKCHTPKEAYFPEKQAALFGRDRHPAECDCQKAQRLEREAAEQRRKHLDTVEDLRRRGFTNPTMQEWTFANDNRCVYETGADWNVPLRPGLSDGGCATVVRAGSAGPGCLGLR